MKELLSKINLLSNRELEVLSSFSIGSPRAAKIINEFVAIEYSTISRSIDKLEKLKLIEEANGVFSDDFDRENIFKNGRPVNPPVDSEFKVRGSFYVRCKNVDEKLGTLLDLILLSSVIHSNVMAFIRLIFPYGKDKAFDEKNPRLESELDLMYGHLWNAIMAVRDKFYYETTIDEILLSWMKVLKMAERGSWYWKLRRRFGGNDLKNFEVLMEELGKSVEIRKEIPFESKNNNSVVSPG